MKIYEITNKDNLEKKIKNIPGVPTARKVYKNLTKHDFNIAPGIDAQARLNPLKRKATANISGRGWDARGEVNKNLDWKGNLDLNLGDFGKFSGDVDQDRQFNLNLSKDKIPYLGGSGSLGYSSGSGDVAANYSKDLGGGSLTGSAGYNPKSKDKSFRIGWSKKF
jgi:hypothetical protein